MNRYIQYINTMDWEKVATSLEDEYHSLTKMDNAAFPDFAQRDMLSRAQIARMLANALRAGLPRAE